jgi:hypothetical protein
MKQVIYAVAVNVPFDAPDKEVAGAYTPAISLSIMRVCPDESAKGSGR